MKAVAENIGLRSLQDDFGEVCQLTLVKSKKKSPLTAVEGAHGQPSSDLTTWKSSLCVDEEFFISNKIN
ncbi:unnamed protein product [Prunus armeniaca]